MIAWLALAMVGAANPGASYPARLDLPDQRQWREAIGRISTRTGIPLPRQGWPLGAGEVRRFLDQALARDPKAI
ncbi:MAG TPA: hypothetical protein PKY05_19280, partial [Fibrobacteria bacterium]|nr:hypothetical protein [Fibrobacteria bacterium]